MPLSFSSGACKALGFAGMTSTVPASGAAYSFVSSPFGPSAQYNPMPAVPTGIKETNEGFNDQTFVFYVNGVGAGVRPLYWRIKHITTSAADFASQAGEFYSNNWGTTAYNPGYSWYNTSYGEELGRFGIELLADNTTEGSETFQIEVRENSFSGPVVLTSSIITVSDTSAPPTFVFDTVWPNWNFYLENGLVEASGQLGELKVIATNIPISTETYIYYTIIPGPGVTTLDLITFTYSRFQDYTLPTGQMYIYNEQYYDSSVGGFKNHPYGWGRFFVSPRNDSITEGNETFQIELRLYSTTGPVVATSPVFTIKDPIVVGQQEYTTAGTYTWTAPANVTSVSVVAIGGGGSGTLFQNSGVAKIGGGGGGLGWKNNIPVIPGNSYTVQVGAASQDSYFISNTIVKGGYGGGGFNGGGGTYVGDGGGNGGSGSVATVFNNQYIGGGGGGGAGGYTGNGGNAGIARNGGEPGFTYAQNGLGGGGAGGYSNWWGGPSYFGGGNGGGGVGIFGEDTNGTTTTTGFNPSGAGGGGSGGGSGGSTYYSFYGGGAGGSYGGGGGGASSNNPSDTGIGSSGAVRIIWGPGRAFPSTYTFTINELPPYPAVSKAIFGYGYTNTDVSITNLVSNTGIIASDTTGVGTARSLLAATGYGTDKVIFGYGYTAFGSTYYSMTNLVTNTGAVGNDVTGVGSARYGLAAAKYGTDKAIFGYGYTSYSGVTNYTNLVSNTGVVANDVANIGDARYELAAAGYGTDKAIFGYGYAFSMSAVTNLVSNTGVVSNSTSGVGTPRAGLAAAGYGTDKAIFGYGNDGSYLSITNLVSNTGVVSTDSTGVYSTARRRLAAAGYGYDKAIFGYGYNGGSQQSVTNLVSNTGVIASDTTGVGTARSHLAAASYG